MSEEDPPSSAIVFRPICMSLGDLAGKSLSKYLLLHEDGLLFPKVSLTLLSGATIVMSRESVTSRMISGGALTLMEPSLNSRDRCTV